MRNDINLLDPDTFIEGVPYEWFAYLRQHAPVFRHPMANGRGPWIITRYRDLVEVSRDAQNYSSRRAAIAHLRASASEDC